MCLISLIAVFLSGACATHNKFQRISDASQEVLLIANQSGDKIPFTVSLTVRINSGLFGEDAPGKIVMLWIERKPDGRYYRAREEISIEPSALAEDLYFYRNYSVTLAGVSSYNVIIFPDNAALRRHSNKINVRAQQNPSQEY